MQAGAKRRYLRASAAPRVDEALRKMAMQGGEKFAAGDSSYRIIEEETKPVSVRITGIPSSRVEGRGGKFDATFWVLTVAMAAVWYGLWLFPGKRQAEELEGKLAALRVEVSDLRSRLRIARRGLEALQKDDPLAWERVARTKLGWIAPGEVLAYPDEPPQRQVPGTGGPSGEIADPTSKIGIPAANAGDPNAGRGGSVGAAAGRRGTSGSDTGEHGAGRSQEPSRGAEPSPRRKTLPVEKRDTSPLPDRKTPHEETPHVQGPVRLAEPRMPPSL